MFVNCSLSVHYLFIVCLLSVYCLFTVYYWLAVCLLVGCLCVSRYLGWMSIVGGALATLAAAELTSRHPHIQLFTFESPRVFGDAASIYVSRRIDRIWRISHCRDPAVHWPPGTLGGFQHVVGEYYYECGFLNSGVSVPVQCEGREDISCAGKVCRVGDTSL